MPHRVRVKTSAGTVLGRQDAGVSVFWNIPYAAAPVGTGRFAAPVAPAPWSGVRDAGEPGPTAPAALRAGFGPLDMSALLGSGWATGEDYLGVNVWTPSPHRDRLPVMVYVHGGGFLNGSGRAELYDGTGFARDGVVLVTLNYRLGVTGWLDVPGAPANRGLLDVIAALGWVREVRATASSCLSSSTAPSCRGFAGPGHCSGTGTCRRTSRRACTGPGSASPRPAIRAGSRTGPRTEPKSELRTGPKSEPKSGPKTGPTTGPSRSSTSGGRCRR
ncbi:carboxylesterase family protein [Streptomyces sp. SID8375]|nr:carboxylesterase family protein [Streptomyces sp. SID8375]